MSQNTQKNTFSGVFSKYIIKQVNKATSVAWIKILVKNIYVEYVEN